MYTTEDVGSLEWGINSSSYPPKIMHLLLTKLFESPVTWFTNHFILLSLFYAFTKASCDWVAVLR